MDVTPLNNVKKGQTIKADHYNRIVKERNFVRQMSGTPGKNSVSQIGDSSCWNFEGDAPKIIKWFPAMIMKSYFKKGVPLLNDEVFYRVFGFTELEISTSGRIVQGHYVASKDVMPRESYDGGESSFAFEIGQHYVPVGKIVMIFELEWDGANRAYAFQYDGDGSFWAEIIGDPAVNSSGHVISTSGPVFDSGKKQWKHPWKRVYGIQPDGSVLQSFPSIGTWPYVFENIVFGIGTPLPWDTCDDVNNNNIHNYVVDVKGRKIPEGAVVRVVPQATWTDKTSIGSIYEPYYGQMPWYVTDYYAPGVVDEVVDLDDIGDMHLLSPPGNGPDYEFVNTDDWNRDTAFARGENGFRIAQMTRVAYNHAGDKILYGFYRVYTYDAFGMVDNVTHEYRYTIDTPQACP